MERVDAVKKSLESVIKQVGEDVSSFDAATFLEHLSALTEGRIVAIENSVNPLPEFHEYLPLLHAEMYVSNLIETGKLHDALALTSDQISAAVNAYLADNPEEVHESEKLFVQEFQDDKKCTELRENAEQALIRSNLKAYHLQAEVEEQFVRKIIWAGSRYPYLIGDEEPEADLVETQMRIINSLALYATIIAEKGQVEKFLAMDDETAESRFLDFCHENRDALKVQAAKFINMIEQRKKQ